MVAQPEAAVAVVAPHPYASVIGERNGVLRTALDVLDDGLHVDRTSIWSDLREIMNKKSEPKL